MVAAGIVDEDERFELIGGEAVPMSPKGARHELVKMVVNRHLVLTAPQDLSVIPETTLWLDDTTFVVPDFCIFPATIAPGDLRGADVLLAIEIADASLAYDTGRKIGIYAAHGFAEVWVVDARRLVTKVHRALGAQGYREIVDVAVDGDLVAVRRPEIRLNLAALGLVPDAGS
jgi:Uma2 family endonuclease